MDTLKTIILTVVILLTGLLIPGCTDNVSEDDTYVSTTDSLNKELQASIDSLEETGAELEEKLEAMREEFEMDTLDATD